MKNNIPDVSIIITNYNYGRYISRSVRSCLSQKYVSTEVIVIDDNSTDDSFAKLMPFEHQLRSFKTPKNLGVAAAANMGIQNSRGQFVIRVDADDFVNSDMCYIMRRYLVDNHDAFCVSCDYFIVDDHENILERKYAEKDDISCGIMYRRDLLMELGGYNPEMRHKEEKELRKRLGEYYNIHHLRMPFYRYRMHNSNKTKSKEYEETRV